jgi:lysozyme
MLDMKYSNSGLDLTKRFEGCRLSAYQDSAGYWTIGYGHRLEVKAGDTCTQQEADQWLENDIAWAISVVNRFVTVQLTQGEFDALVDFVFNVGISNFHNSTLLKLLNSGAYQEAAKQFERWDRSGGVEVAGLLRRRQAERDEFNS